MLGGVITLIAGAGAVSAVGHTAARVLVDGDTINSAISLSGALGAGIGGSAGALATWRKGGFDEVMYATIAGAIIVPTVFNGGVNATAAIGSTVAVYAAYLYFTDKPRESGMVGSIGPTA